MVVLSLAEYLLAMKFGTNDQVLVFQKYLLCSLVDNIIWIYGCVFGGVGGEVFSTPSVIALVIVNELFSGSVKYASYMMPSLGTVCIQY